MDAYFQPGGDTARRIFENATVAGVFRHKWQCTAELSPASWGLRIKPFWTPDELGPRVVRLIADIQSHFETIVDEGYAAAIEHDLPRGEKPFGQAFLVKEGSGWDQVTVWGGPISGWVY